MKPRSNRVKSAARFVRSRQLPARPPSSIVIAILMAIHAYGGVHLDVTTAPVRVEPVHVEVDILR